MQGEIQDQDWGESRWEEIVLHPRVGQEQMGESAVPISNSTAETINGQVDGGTNHKQRV
jgi:hypothetical protein